MNPAQWAIHAKSSGTFVLHGKTTVQLSEEERISIPHLGSCAGALFHATANRRTWTLG